MKKLPHLFAFALIAVLLQGCVHKVVTVPVKVAYKTTKGMVKGTAKVIDVLTDDDEKTKKDK